MTAVANPPAQRLDKWLWFARVMKSRRSAAQLVGGGKVRVNRVRVVKPSHLLHEGDVLTIALRGEVRVLEVLAVGERRGPPQEARLLYRAVTGAPGTAEAAEAGTTHRPRNGGLGGRG
jgi:ribosome-associated heat shock protein Hsp15